MTFQERRAAEWLFGEHSPAVWLDWLERIRYGYVVRAVGGHANDTDEVLLELRCTERDVDGVFGRFACAPLAVGTGGWVTVRGITLYLERGSDRLRCSFFRRDKWEIAQEDVDALLTFERYIDDWGFASLVLHDSFSFHHRVTKEYVLAMMSFYQR
jgi:hypothetical protein